MGCIFLCRTFHTAPGQETLTWNGKNGLNIKMEHFQRHITGYNHNPVFRRGVQEMHPCPLVWLRGYNPPCGAFLAHHFELVEYTHFSVGFNECPVPVQFQVFVKPVPVAASVI